MATTKQIIPENIHLKDIIFIKDEMIVLDKKLKSKPEYNFSIAHNTQHNLEKEAVKIRLFIDLFGEINGEKINQGGNYEVDFYFKIDNMSNHYETIENHAIFDGIFISTLLGICYSTMRGILLQKWEKTILEGIILPVISIPKLLNTKKEI
jgi:hypothetical protein